MTDREQPFRSEDWTNGHMDDQASAPDEDIWDQYIAELLRWNRQINLVSRNLGRRDLQRLAQECTEAADRVFALVAEIADARQRIQKIGESETGGRGDLRMVYYDVGSGAGIPGVVWHVRMGRNLSASNLSNDSILKSYLVEPRQKRAWFLERVLRLLELENIKVLNQRWAASAETIAEVPADADFSGPTIWIMSLRALKLTEQEVFDGWLKATELTGLPDGDILAICRFRPSQFKLEDTESAELGLPPLVSEYPTGSSFPQQASMILELGDNIDTLTGLLVSLHMGPEKRRSG